MSYTNAIVVSWDRAVPGREANAAEHFQEFASYLGELQRDGTVDAFEPVFLNAHGGGLNGFFLIKGKGERLATVQLSDRWNEHVTRAMVNMAGFSAIGAGCGDAVGARMELWQKWSAK